MAIKKVNGENSRMVDKKETLARDLAMEITVGCDRFDRDDLFFFLSEVGASKDDILLLRNQTLEVAKDMQPDGHELDTIAFFNKELDFWLDTKAFEEYMKVGRPLPGMKDNKAAKNEASKPKKVVPQIKR